MGTASPDDACAAAFAIAIFVCGLSAWGLRVVGNAAAVRRFRWIHGTGALLLLSGDFEGLRRAES